MPRAATSQKSKATPRVNGNGGDSVEDRLGRVEDRLGNVEDRLGSVENRLGKIEDSIIEIKTRLDYMPTHKDFAELIKTNAEMMSTMQDTINKAMYKSALLTLGIISVVATVTGIIFGFVLG